MSTLAVVEEVLRDTGVPMSVREIVERAGDALPTRSKTPDTVVARDLSVDIKRKGESSSFARTAPGRYTLRGICAATQAEISAPTETTGVLSSVMRQDRAAVINARQPAVSDSSQSSALR